MSVVVPFLGDSRYARRTAAALRGLDLASGDEVIVADNTPERIARAELAGVADVVDASARRSSYFARNAGARVAKAAWLLFLDADCVPRERMLAAYLAEPVDAATGILAGAIADHPAHDTLLARYARSRNFYRGETGLQGSDGGYAPTGNLMVRRAAFEEVGGFAEGIRSAGDVDLCWRVQGRGWRLERRPLAVAEHRHREDLRSFVAMLARYGAGSAWLNARYPGSSPRWPLSAYELGRSGLDAVRHALAGEREEAAFRLLDGLGLLTHNWGYRASSNSAGE